MRDVTACFLLRPGQVLLAMKKRGFGAGRWNGYGGKSEPQETVIQAAVREIHEESGGIAVQHETLEKAAEIEFLFTQKPEWDQRLHAFLVRSWENDPQESEEMSPQWFDIRSIPWHAMWPEDKLWLPRILSGEKISGRITFRDLEGNAESVQLQEGIF